MTEKKTSAAYRAIKRLIKACYPKMEIVGAENLPAGEAVLVGNHAQIHGPVACELYLEGNRYTWCAGQMLHLKEVPAYAFKDFWSHKPRAVQWFYHLLSYLIAPLSVFVFNNANTIPVYKDARILNTFRETMEKLTEGARVVILPEHHQPHNQILCDFQERFVDVARLYYVKTRKELAFVPMYITPKLKKIVVGEPVRFRGDQPIEQERRRICDALMDAITGLAVALPAHTVIPYENLPKSQYPSSRPAGGA